MKKRMICCLLAMVLLLGIPFATASAADQQLSQDGFKFVLRDDHAVVAGSDGGTVIPAEVNGLPVTEIADSAFRKSTSLTEITIPDSVKVFGNSAFRDCTNLQAVHYSGTPEFIEDDVFSGVGLSARPENVDDKFTCFEQ